MAIFIGIRISSWVKCLYVVTHTGGVFCSSDNTWPIFVERGFTMAKIAKRRDRWVIDFYDTKGKRRWITLPKGSTKREAKEKLRELEDQIRTGVYMPKNKMPKFKTVANDWLVTKKPDILKFVFVFFRIFQLDNLDCSLEAQAYVHKH